MAGIQLDDIRKYHLPIGALGLLNQFLNLYVLLSFTCARRPLWPWHPIRHRRYSNGLCTITMILVLGFDFNSISHLHRWELTTSVVGNMILLLSYIGVALGGLNSQLDKEAAAGAGAGAGAGLGPGPQVNTVEVETPHIVVADADADQRNPPPPYSQDPERCDAALDDAKNQAPRPAVSESDVVGVPENPANRTATKAVDGMGSLSTSTTIREEPPASRPVQKPSNADTDTGAALYMLLAVLPWTIIVFVGLVGHLCRDLPADWHGVSHVRSIVITFSFCLIFTVLGMAASALRAIRREEEADVEVGQKKRYTWKDSVFLGSIVLSFFVVSFDKWLVAALVGDIGGTKHILSDGALPLVYMIVTKLPALAL